MSLSEGDRREYARPPVVEGLCQFTYVKPLDWTVATPGQLFQQLQSEYPVDPEQQEQLQAELQLLAAQESTAPGFKLNRGPSRIIFRDETRTRVVVANSQSISVNSLKPYEGWPSLSARLDRAIKALHDAGFNPLVSSVSLRYINRIEVPPVKFDSEKYFTPSLHVAAGEGAYLSAFMTRTESFLSDGTKVVITFGSAENPPDRHDNAFGFLLDVEVTRNSFEGIKLEEASFVADQLKEIENQQFEAMVTDECRELFR